MEALEAFAALAHPTRLGAFRLLVKAGPPGRPAGEIAEALGTPAPTMSFHLAHLERAGLAAARRDGRLVFYAADYSHMQGLIRYLLEDCCRGPQTPNQRK